MDARTNLKTLLVILVFLLAMAGTNATGGTIYVDVTKNGNGSSWAAAFKYLQDAFAVAQDGNDIWVAQGIYKPDANSSIEDLVTAGLSTPTGIALDVAGGKMYWTDRGTDKIQRANLDGSGIEDLVTTGLSNPPGIALDVAAGKMYWTDMGTYKIQRANMSDGSNVEDLVTAGLSTPYSIALDVAAGKMYWTDAGTDKIQRANMSDGSGVEDLVTTGLFSTQGIALDVAAGKMYWTEGVTGKIQRANMSDGNSVEDLVTGLSNPYGIALDVAAGKMYWTDYGTNKIQRTNMFGSGDREATFQLINGVGIYGGFAGGESSVDERDWITNETILSGDINTPDVNTDNSYHVVTGSGTEPNAILDGFTITAGNANGAGYYTYGGGMHNNQGRPTVVNCTFGGNSADSGGGMWNNDNSSPTVTNCNFNGNSAGIYGGGMWNTLSSSPTVTNCNFSGNSAGIDGGGMKNSSSSSTTVTNCNFSGNSANSGGGMFNWNSSPTVTNCTFTVNNSGGHGGGMSNTNNTNAILTNCIFSGNSATNWGGGVLNGTNSSTMVTNCTFAGNSANYGGGFYNSNSNLGLTNCILWGNSATGSGDEILTSVDTKPNISFSDVAGCGGSGAGWNSGLGIDGGGNIDTDPLFADPNGPDGIAGTEDDNLRLMPDSPCIDAGDNDAVPADTTDLDNDGNTVEPIPWDLDGRDRFADGDCNDTIIVDMGTYEFAWIYIGDFYGGCDVDFYDFAVLGLTWRLEEGQPGYDPNCNISLLADSIIDERDLDIFTDNWLAGK